MAMKKFATCELSARAYASLGVVMDAHLERGQSEPASMVDESFPQSHLAAVGLIDSEPD